MDLKEALLYLMGGGSGAVVYWLMEKVSFLKALAPDIKRYVSWLLSAVLPVAAWGIFLAFGYEPLPADWQAAVEKVFALVFVAFSVSQGAHAFLKLRKS